MHSLDNPGVVNRKIIIDLCLKPKTTKLANSMFTWAPLPLVFSTITHISLAKTYQVWASQQRAPHHRPITSRRYRLSRRHQHSSRWSQYDANCRHSRRGNLLSFPCRSRTGPSCGEMPGDTGISHSCNPTCGACYFFFSFSLFLFSCR